MTTRGQISLRDIAHKITFFQNLTYFICLKHLMLRTLDLNMKRWNLKIILNIRRLYQITAYQKLNLKGIKIFRDKSFIQIYNKDAIEDRKNSDSATYMRPALKIYNAWILVYSTSRPEYFEALCSKFWKWSDLKQNFVFHNTSRTYYNTQK